MPSRSMADLSRQLREEPKRKPATPKRTRRKRTPPAASVQVFPLSGELIRMTVYLSREEWEAFEGHREESGESATEIVRRALRKELTLS